jgi:hypothetical protein
MNVGAGKLLDLAGLEEQREHLGCGIVRVTVKLRTAQEPAQCCRS